MEDRNLLFFNPIKSAPWKGFADAEKKVKFKVKSKANYVEVQWDILGHLVAISATKKAEVDIDKALVYGIPLYQFLWQPAIDLEGKHGKANYSMLL